MGVPMVKSSSLLPRCVLLTILLAPGQLFAQQPTQLGKIIGNIRVSRGETPAHRILVALEMRGTPVDSAYSDDQGRFGFYNLVANEYRITVNDDAFEPFAETVRVDPSTAPMNFVQMALVPRAS